MEGLPIMTDVIDTGDMPPSVLTSEVYNEAENIFNMLQNKEKLVSFLDCTTLLRGMGMNPTLEDMDKMKARMAEPVFRLEQWRRAEELRREKERRKEEMREMKNKGRSASKRKDKKKEAEKKEDEKPEKIIPVEEIKNIDWNIFITCAEEIYRDSAREEKEIVQALKAFQVRDKPVINMDKLVEIVTAYGDNVFSPAEVKMLRASLPESCTFAELAARIQGTYVPPTQEELDRAMQEEIEARKKKEEAAKAAADDPLAGL